MLFTNRTLVHLLFKDMLSLNSESENEAERDWEIEIEAPAGGARNWVPLD